jgi:UDP-glucose 4-epimerase
MNFLLIGGNGFIGSHISDILIKNNHKVRVYDLFMEKYRSPLKEVDYRIYPIDDLNALYEAMLDIDVVFHLASSTVPSTSILDPLLDVNGNLVSSINILNTAVRAKIKKIIYFSSGGAIYGSVNGLIKEENELNPISSYGIIKSTIEKYFLLYGKKYNIETIIFRPSNPYGPRQGNFIAQGVISTFLRKLSNNETISVFGTGENMKDYIYIEDLALICYKIIISAKSGIFNIGTGVGTKINQILDIIKSVTNMTPKIDYLERKLYDVPDFILDISKSKSITGNFDYTTIEEGVLKTWHWINVNSKNF